MSQQYLSRKIKVHPNDLFIWDVVSRIKSFSFIFNILLNLYNLKKAVWKGLQIIIW